MSRSPTSSLSEKIVLRLIALIATPLFVKTLFDAVRRPLQLDEFATWWIVQRDLVSAVFSTAPYNPHPLYYGLEWLTTRAVGLSTQGLRVLSYVTFFLTCLLLLRFLRRRFSLPWQLVVALLVTMSPLTELINARPYQLGFLFSVGAMITASNGLHLGSAIVAFLACSLAFLTHQSFITAYVIPVAFYLFQSNAGWFRRVQWISVFGLASLLFTLSVRALLPNMANLEAVSEQFYFVGDFYRALSSSPLLSGCIVGNALIAGLFIAWQNLRGEPRATFRGISGDTDFRVGAAIIAAGLLAVGALSVTAGHSLFFDRYMLVLLIGYLLMVASTLRTLVSYEFLGVLLGVPLIVLAVHIIGGSRDDSWYAAVTTDRSTDPRERVLSLVHAGHPFGRLVHYNRDAQMSSAWTCPVDFYAPQSDSTVTLPIVQGAIDPSDSSRYRLPWTSVELKSFHSVELMYADRDQWVMSDELDAIRLSLDRKLFQADARVYYSKSFQVPLCLRPITVCWVGHRSAGPDRREVWSCSSAFFIARKDL